MTAPAVESAATPHRRGASASTAAAADEWIDDPATAAALRSVRALLAPGADVESNYLAVGTSGRPTFLLPRDRRVGAAACRAYNALRPLSVRRRRQLVAAAFSAGLGPVVATPVVVTGAPPDPTEPPLLEALADLLGVGPLFAAVGLGAVDDWWTPVVQLFDTSGVAVGFAKVGTTPLGAEAVRNEAALLAGFRHHPVDGLVVPRLVARGRWSGAEVVLTAPLPDTARSLTETMPPRCPLPSHPRVATLADSQWWGAILAELRGATGEERSRTDALAAAADARTGDRPTPLGLAHGDWVPWNLARASASVDSSLVAWDWEYGATDAPLGFDDVHGGFQVARHRGADLRGAFAVAALHGREVRPEPHLLDTLAVAHPVSIVARELRRRRLGSLDAPAPTPVGDEPMPPDDLSVALDVAERRLDRCAEEGTAR
ncbi:MAG: hypothetical protein ACKOYM_01465 [Actinomycetes bacterium]